MDVLRLPHGPWKPLLSGKYEGHDISLYQNPARDIFSVVVDKDEEGNPKGLIIIMYRAFLVDGPLESLMNGIKVKTTLIAKKRDEMYRFLLLEGGPKYIGLDRKELAETLAKIGNALYKDSTFVANVAKTMGVKIAPLSDVPKKVAALLLAEPIVLPNLMGSMGETIESFEKVLPLGLNRDGSVVRESVLEFKRAAILGEHDGARKRMLGIAVENALLSGIPVILVTYNAKKYEGMNEPGHEDVKQFGLSPMGFSRKMWKIGEDYFVDLPNADPAALAEAMGVAQDHKAFEEIASRIFANKDSVTGIKDILGAPGKKKFHEIQAERILKHHDAARGNIFGRNNVTQLLTTGDMGEITVIEVSQDIWTPLALETLLQGLHRYIEKRGKTKKMRALLVLEDADKVVPYVKSPITEAIVREITELVDYGVGYVLEAKNEHDVHKTLVEGIETTVRTISDEEVGVRLLTKRPYRLKLRPFVSNIAI